MADGQIIIETGIDTSGFEKGTKELTAAINSLTEQVKTLSVKIDTAISGIGKAAESAGKSVQGVAESAGNAAKETERAGAKATDSMGALEKGAKAAQKAVEKTGDALSKAFDDTAVKEAASEIKKVVSEDTKEAIPDDSLLENVVDNVGGTGTADKINASLSSAKSAVSSFLASLREAGQTASQESDAGVSAAARLKEAIYSLGAAPTAKSLTSNLTAVSSSLSKLEGLSQKAAGGSAAALEQFDAKAEQTREQIDQMERSLQTFAGQKIPTDEYKAIQKQIETETAKLNTLIEAQEKYIASGGKKSSSGYKSRQYEIDQYSNSIKNASAELRELEASGGAFTLGANTAEYSNLSSGISAAKDRMVELENEARKGPGAASTLKNAFSSALSGIAAAASSAKEKIKEIADAAKSAAKSAFKKLGSAVSSAAKNFIGLSTSTGKSNDTFKKGLSTILKYGFGIRSLYFLFKRLRTAITDGFENLGGYSGEVNSALTSMSNALAKLKNSLSTAFAPVVTAIAPYVTYLINLLTDAINVIGEFFAALMGSTTYTKVASATGDYTSATEDATDASEDATEAAENQLASFDELNVLSDSSSDSSGSSSSDDSTSGVTYETVSISSAISDWVQALKDAWNAEDFTEVGELIAEKINEVFEYAYDLISWDNVGETITYYADAICEVFNSLVDNIDWELIGATFGTGINTLVNTIDLLLVGIDWENLGASFADGFNGLVYEVDWDKLGTTIGDYINALIDTAQGFLDGIDASAIGSSFASVFTSMINTVNWTKLGKTVATGVNGVIDAAQAFLDGFDASSIGKSFASVINAIVNAVDWDGLGETVGDSFGAVVDAIESFLLDTDFEGAGEGIASLVNSLVESVDDTITSTDWSGCAANVVSGLNAVLRNTDFSALGKTTGDAIVAAFEMVSTAIEEFDWYQLGKDIAAYLAGIDWAAVASAMFEAIGAAFGGFAAFLGGLIADGLDGIGDYFADEVEAAGGNILLGILNGIVNGISNIATWIYENVFEPFIKGLCSVFGISSPATAMEEYGEYILEGILQGIVNGIKNIGTWIQNNVFAPISEALGLGNLSATVSVALETATTWAGDAWTVIQGAGQTFTTTVSGALKKAKDWSSDAWTAVTATTGTVTRTLKQGLSQAGSYASDAVTAMKKTSGSVVSTLKQKLSQTGSYASDAVTAMKKKAGSVTSTLKQKLAQSGSYASDVVTAMKKTAGSVTSTLKQKLAQSGTYASDVVTAMKKTAGSVTSTLKQKLSQSGTYASDAITAMKKASGDVVSTLKQKLTKYGTYNSDALAVVNQTLGDITSTLTQKLKKGTGSNWSSDALDVIQNAASKTITVTVNIASKVASALKTLLGLSTGGVIVGGKVTRFASGGSISRGAVSWWDTVQKYASGTSSAHGTVFVAGEAGPEIVGHVGGRTEVLNKSQLAETMYTAVVNGIGDAINSFWAALSEKMAECVNAAISSMEYLVTQVPAADNSDLIAIMQTIANTVAYAEPAMATGTVTPYATREADIEAIAATLNDGSDAIVSAIGTNTASATAQIVAAIKAYCQTDVTVDAASLTTSIINEINRRTRMTGTSPIAGVS